MMKDHRESSMQKAFGRYKDFTNLEELFVSSTKPLRKSIRANGLKCSPQELGDWGMKKGWILDAVPWCREAFFIDRVDREEALGKDLLHLLGYFYMQEASSMLPVELLSPVVGDVVLDMSAAPGSKSTQIASRIEIRSQHHDAVDQIKSGLVVTNDVQEKRIWSLVTNLQRCGVTSAIVTRKVGQWFAGHMTEVFDKVLCDAPCTAQGTIRKDSDALTYCSMENVGKMSTLQRDLLESAVHACKVGGRIVYSTCTLTPEENEKVVLEVLSKFPTQLSVLHPTEAIGRDVGDGSMWQQAINDSLRVQEFLLKDASSLSSCTVQPMLRVWPQTFDTEGFFCAVLQKHVPTRHRHAKKLEYYDWKVVPKARMREIAARLEDWYGASFLREDEMLIEWKEQLSVMPQSALALSLPVQPYLGGLPFGKSTTHGLVRLSHEMALLRGHEATKQLLSVDEGTLREMMSGKNIERTLNVDDGDILLSFASSSFPQPLTFGRGVYKAGTILNRLPRETVRMFS